MRLWDTGTGWAQVNTAPGVYDWTRLDAILTNAQTHGVDVLYDLARTPGFAQCGPSTTSPCVQSSVDCAYATSIGGSPGQCYWPGDLNPDGTGTNQYWKDWITAMVTHSMNLDSTHARIRYYEIWNEPNVTGFWRGTDAQLARMTLDAACIIKGVGIGCTSPGIDPSAMIVSIAPTNGGSQIDAELNSYFAAGAADVVDVIAFHGYMGANPDAIATLVDRLKNGAIATYGLQSKPLFDTEFSWGLGPVFTDPDERAGFVARSLILHASAGVDRVFWYAWSTSGTLWSDTNTTGCNTPDASGTGFICSTGIAYQQVENWLAGASLASACSLNGTVWTCNLARPGGYQAQAVWDSAQSCSGGTCTTSGFTVDPAYTQYRDLKGAITSLSGQRTVRIGYKPILLENTL